MISYGYLKKINGPLDTAIEAVTAALQSKGFGVMMRIDIHKRFKEKLGIDFQQYVILGACNPQNAYKALQLEENVGLFLPCNVIVYEKKGEFYVGIIRPTVTLGSIDNKPLTALAAEVESSLQDALKAI